MIVNTSILFFIKQISDEDIILTYFKYFWGFLQSYLIGTKNAKVENTCIRYICISDPYIENVCVESMYIKDTCIGSISAIKHLKIYSKSQILEVRPFDIS